MWENWYWWLAGTVFLIAAIWHGIRFVRRGRTRTSPNETPEDRPPATQDSAVPLQPYEARVALGARSGGVASFHAVDENQFEVDENVQFTVYRPRVIVPEKWHPLLAFAHLSENRPDAPASEPDPVQEVRRQAEQVLGEAEARHHFQPVTQDARQAVPQEGELTLVPRVPGVEFNPSRRSFRWIETVHREEFRLRAGAELDGTTARGQLSVFLGDILIADVPLTLRVDSTHQSDRDDQAMEAESASRYRKIFASYSHKDLQIVEQVERLARVFGDQYLRDWTHLRSGEVWDERLLEMIREADLFQLFWSHNAMESEYVRQECEYALSLNRPNFIRPTYWEDPLPQDPARDLPPAPLLRFHFERLGAVPIPAPLPTTSAGSPKNVGRYIILQPLAQGALGSVDLAEDSMTGMKVVIRWGVRLSEQDTRLARLHQRGIAQILDSGVLDGQSYVVTEYVPGGALRELLERGPLPEVEATRLIGGVAQALNHAHEQGIVHRNLTPSEILLDAEGQPKLTGFHPLPPPEELNLTRTGRGLGVPRYLAPEQFRGTPATPASDVFALGVILYESVTGQRPFLGEGPLDLWMQMQTTNPVPPRQINPAISALLEELILRCLAKDPKDRPTAEAVSAALQGSAHLPVRPASSPPRRSGRYYPARKDRKPAYVERHSLWAGVVVAVLIAGALAIWLALR